jgi:dipeptidyl aminopeptidase/acylaminoacyl peptidase
MVSMLQGMRSPTAAWTLSLVADFPRYQWRYRNEHRLRQLYLEAAAHVPGSASAPLLLAHAVGDPRVPVGEVDESTERARTVGVPVRYLRFSDQGHHVRANPNRETLFASIENLLEVHLARRR